MQQYFISTRENGGWNTYQSSGIIMNVLPDLFPWLQDPRKNNRLPMRPGAVKENKTITDFPYHLDLEPYEELNIHMESGLPLYYVQYVKERVTEAKTGVEGFSIRTYFDKNTIKLEAGKPIDLIVDVEVKKQVAVEHVMIEVPIPGACSYADKRQQNSSVETYREYYKERTCIFCENMNPGKYTFTIFGHYPVSLVNIT